LIANKLIAYGVGLSVTLELLTASCCYSQTSTNKDDQTVRIEALGPRALRDALLLVENQTRLVITYEDPKYTAPVMHAMWPGGPMALKEHAVSFQYRRGEARTPLELLRRLVATYNKSDGSAVFDVRRSPVAPDILDVVPVQNTEENGHLAPEDSLLSKPITLSASGTYLQVSRAVCALAAKEGEPKMVGPIDMSHDSFTASHTSIAVVQQPIRTVLDTVIDSFRKDGRKVAVTYGLEHQSMSWYVNRMPDISVAQFQLVGLPSNFQYPVLVSVESYRPLLDAIRIVGRVVHTPVVYEDPPWACNCEVMRLADGEVVGLRGGSFTFAFARAAPMLSVLSSAVGEYYLQNNPAQFSCKSVANVTVVCPTRSMTIDDKENIIDAPLLAQPIEIVGTYRLRDAVSDICKSISVHTEKRVRAGSLAPSIADRPVTLTGKYASSYYCLSHIDGQLKSDVSWYLVYDPATAQYQLNAEE